MISVAPLRSRCIQGRHVHCAVRERVGRMQRVACTDQAVLFYRFADDGQPFGVEHDAGDRSDSDHRPLVHDQQMRRRCDMTELPSPHPTSAFPQLFCRQALPVSDPRPFQRIVCGSGLLNVQAHPYRRK